MVDSNIVQAGTGVSLDAFSQTNGDLRQAVAVGDAFNASTAAVSLFGELSVSPVPSSLLSDAFDGGVVETTNVWTTQLGSGGTVTQGGGALSVTAGVTASAYAAIFSKAIFAAPNKGALEPAFRIAIENPIKANVKRFWGVGSVPGTPTVAIPITDGAGFELTEAGVFRAVIYAAGAVAASAVLTTPVDAALHTYWIHYTSGYYLFYSDVTVANTSIPMAFLPVDPGTNSLPVVLLAVNGATPPSAGQSMTSNQVGVGDYAKNTQQISDGTFPWRKATVKAASTAAAAADPALVVALSPNNGLVPGVGATALGKAEDAVSASGDTGIFMLGVRRDALTISASNNGDYNENALDKYGATIIKSELQHKATYSVSSTVAIAAAATDVVTIIGSASKSVSIQKIIISGSQTTGGLVLVKIIKRSTADTGGTSTAPGIVKHETTDAAATAVVAAYTANPGALGTALGTVRSQSVAIPGATATTNDIAEWDFGDLGKPIILAGVTEQLCINLNGATVTGGSLNVDIEFTEE